MTNISAFSIYEGKDKETQNTVMVADSMTTILSTGQKDDSAQKLFVLNGALIMHSGARNPAIEVYDELRKSNVKGPKAISTSILDISNRRNFPAQMPLDFIVSGYEEGKAKIFYINATGFNPYVTDKSSPSDKHFNEQFYAFSGSGSPLANRIVHGQIDLGLDPRPKEITSGLSLMRTIANAATESSGVNDRLQYGVITPTGMHILFHPSIKPNGPEELSDYLKRLLNSQFTEHGEFGTQEYIEARLNNRPSWLICRDFYNAFDLDLSMLGYASSNYRTISDGFKEDRISLETLNKQKQEYHSRKKVADKAVSAFLSGDAKNILDYLKSERELREESYLKAKLNNPIQGQQNIPGL